MFLDAHLHAGKQRVGISEDCFLFLNSASLNDIDMLVENYSDFKNVFLFLGIHPWYCDEFNSEVLNRFDILLKLFRFGIGEIGLDRISGQSIENQINVFRKQLEYAIKNNLCVSVHCVKAWELLFPLLKKAGSLRFVIHGFNSSEKVFDDFLTLGAYISFGTRQLKNKNCQKLIQKCPLSRLLVETDSQNGQEKEILMDNYRKIANLKNINIDILKEAVIENGEILTV